MANIELTHKYNTTNAFQQLNNWHSNVEITKVASDSGVPKKFKINRTELE